MYRKPSKKQLLIQRTIIFAIMVLSVTVIVAGTVLFILGYRIDGTNGRFEQGALVQFDSQPNGATVSIDGISTGSQTASKRSVLAGEHAFLITKDGYRPWERTISVEAGTLTWLDYVRLVPTTLDKKTVRSYEEVSDVEAAPDRQTIIVQRRDDRPEFDLVDIRSQEVRSTNVRLPDDVLTQADDVQHRYELDEWDASGRYILVRHFYGDSSEWVVFDTENVSESVNVTRLLSIGLSDLQFASTNGNVLYGLSDGVVRKLDLRNATISAGLASQVESFDMYETSIFTYIGRDASNRDIRVAGLYRDGDRSPHIIMSTEDEAVPLRIDTARYYGDDYIVVSEGLEVTVLGGSYPASGQSTASTLDEVTTFTLSSQPEQLNFSPDGDYILARSGLSVVTYEIEHDRLNRAEVETSESKSRSLQWLDAAHLSATYDGHLSMRDFDGTNVHVIMPIVNGFDATLSQNGRYIYGVNKTDDTYRLERVTMILE
ncbi:hypothetical protein CL689_00330 [Candidatus Saccharibacteria bacterium]|nr:hypothetical protein [Candidatus Saccharibacteria bacterium]MBQ68495.1 hypothetical protein [Candidatus Saccharibacteria bacterium]|tara:strand:+ start:2165 stop:3625 length:1461 start_codon:yes stop_codon:yes gene_type:complete